MTCLLNTRLVGRLTARLMRMPGRPRLRLLQNTAANLSRQLGNQLLWRQEYLRVLLQQSREVLEQRMLGTKEIKLMVSLLLFHQVRKELSAVARYELRGQFDDVQF